MAAATTMAKMERWKELSTRYYQDIQPIIVQAYAKLNELSKETKHEPRQSAIQLSIDIKPKGRIEATRQHLYEGAVLARSVATRRIIDEQIKISYRDL